MTAEGLRAFRARLGLSWAALARAMGRADDRALRRWASGRQEIPAADSAWLDACDVAGAVLPRPKKDENGQ